MRIHIHNKYLTIYESNTIDFDSHLMRSDNLLKYELTVLKKTHWDNIIWEYLNLK